MGRNKRTNVNLVERKHQERQTARISKETKENENTKDRKRGQMLVLGMERVGGVEFGARLGVGSQHVCVNRIGMLLQERRNQHQLPLIQKP